MKFSIVIPAFNEAPRIRETVLAAKNQNIPRENFEIIVVDNNSEDRTAEIAKQAGADKVVSEARQGTNMARERGRKESRGEIIAFLDADCAPPRDWLEKIHKHLQKKEVVAVSGPYDYGFRGIARILDKIYTSFLMPNLPRILYFLFRKRAGMIIGGNFGVRRWALQKIGGLPPLAFYGDDSTTAMMLSRGVGMVVFDPKLRIRTSPRRFDEYGILPIAILYAFHYFKVYFKKQYSPR